MGKHCITLCKKINSDQNDIEYNDLLQEKSTSEKNITEAQSDAITPGEVLKVIGNLKNKKKYWV